MKAKLIFILFIKKFYPLMRRFKSYEQTLNIILVKLNIISSFNFFPFDLEVWISCFSSFLLWKQVGVNLLWCTSQTDLSDIFWTIIHHWYQSRMALIHTCIPLSIFHALGALQSWSLSLVLRKLMFSEVPVQAKISDLSWT